MRIAAGVSAILGIALIERALSWLLGYGSSLPKTSSYYQVRGGPNGWVGPLLIGVILLIAAWKIYKYDEDNE